MGDYNFFVLTELQKTTSEYEEKQKSGGAAEKTMFSLLWDVDELKRLNDEGRRIRTEISATLSLLALPAAARHEHNVPRRLASLRTQLSGFIKGLFHFKRTPATHMFVLMVSSEWRDHKPYALPVQCFPYAGLKEKDMRSIVTDLVKEMVGLGMSVAGKYFQHQFYVTA